MKKVDLKKHKYTKQVKYIYLILRQEVWLSTH